MKTFEEYRSELDVPNLLMSGNCCRHAFNAGQESQQGEIDELQGRIDKLIPMLEHYGYLGWADVLRGVKK